jgi:divalent metal cation (Fe/Co/Zn/Cd) transporter
VVLAAEMKSLLVGEGAAREHQQAIETALPGEGVESVIHLRTLHLGPDELLIAAKIAIPATATAQEIAAAIDAAEQRVRTAVPIAKLIYLEPDLRRPSPAPSDH